MTKYSDWVRYFAQNHWPELPSASPLSDAERELIAKSVRQFQLGEGSDGRTLLRLGGGLNDPDYTQSLERFIREEQRHSEMLGRFLDAQGIPRLERDAVDTVFRLVRRLWGHELMITVLVSAECVAVPYYSALHDATTSPQLKALCRQILRDEAMHLKYQGQTLATLAKDRGFWASSCTRTLHRLMVLTATLVVYAQHRGFCRAAGWSLQSFVGAAFQALSQVERRLPGAAMVGFGWSSPPSRGVTGA
jgi:ferritin-like protein